MKLLAIETATEACSAALLINGGVAEKFCLSQNGHSRLILPMINELLAEAAIKPKELDVLAFGRGPGSFTGVRIATGVIQGIALGLDRPVVPVSNLAAVAQDFFDHNPEDTTFVAMDARMSEIYWGVYRRNSAGYAVQVGDESVLPPSEIEIPEIPGVGIGTGWRQYREELTSRLSGRAVRFEPDHLPRARAVARLAEEAFKHGLSVSAEHALPVYLRDNVAKKESER